MDGGSGGNSVQQVLGAMAQQQLLAVSEGMGVAVGGQERVNCVGVVDGHGGVGFRVSGGGEGDSSGKRKRGRPRKQEVEVRREFVSMAESLSLASTQKRGRGRPKGSGKWQTLAASLGGNALDTAGSNFTPHTLSIQTGENIVQRVGSFTQKAAESVCILSASGAVSSVELLVPASFGGVRRYEGRFDIVSLSGSYANNGIGGINGKNCLLSVQLANLDGALFGGAVGGSLIAGGPTQLVIATFRQRPREKAKVKMANKVAATTPLPTTQNGQIPAAEANGLQTVSQTSAQSIDAVEKFINGHDNHPSPQQFEWTSLQASVPMSQHVMSNFSAGLH